MPPETIAIGNEFPKLLGLAYAYDVCNVLVGFTESEGPPTPTGPAAAAGLTVAPEILLGSELPMLVESLPGIAPAPAACRPLAALLPVPEAPAVGEAVVTLGTGIAPASTVLVVTTMSGVGDQTYPPIFTSHSFLGGPGC